MPNTQSAKKALRQSIRRRAQNIRRKNAYKDVIKTIQKLVLVEKLENAKNFIPQLYQTLDKAAKTNAIKKNKAARLKSRAARSISLRLSNQKEGTK